MKLILAIIQPQKLEAVKEALAKVEVFRPTDEHGLRNTDRTRRIEQKETKETKNEEEDDPLILSTTDGPDITCIPDSLFPSFPSVQFLFL